jgi:regulator of cell morphogenesis and NO signaling
MIVTLRTPIGDIVAKQPRAGAVFEQHAIDYCCEGDQPLEAACAWAKADAALVLRQLQRAATEALEERDWTAAPLGELTDHLVSTHHAQLRRGVAAVVSRLEETAAGAGGRPGAAIEELIARAAWWRNGLEPHLRLEEQRLFPSIVRAEQARLAGRKAAPEPAGTIRREIPLLVREHRATDDGARQLRRAASRVLEPGSAVLAELAALEADLHRHLHLENNILFPRALALEDAYA